MNGYAKPLSHRVSAKSIGNCNDGVFVHGTLMTRNLSSVKTSEPTFRQIFCHGTIDAMDDSDRPFSDIAKRVRWHRALVALDQADYAMKAGLKRAQLNNWESGNYRLSVDGALALRRTYGLSLDFMYEGIDDALPMTLRNAWRDRPDVIASKKSIVNPDA
jgi:DNA-binding XRE family transcriptional regulator